MHYSSKDRMTCPMPAGVLSRRTHLRRLLSLLLVLLLGTGLCGCAPAVFRDIRKEITPNVTVKQVASDPAPFIGKKVLWGGFIALSENKTDKTIFEVVEVPLTVRARPGNPNRSGGRFIIEHAGFLDGAIYAEGRELTVAGEILGTREGKIGEMDYTFPVMKDIKLYLWEKRAEPPYPSHIYIDDPFFYGPYYYPYYYRTWPSRRHPPRREPPPWDDEKDNDKDKDKDNNRDKDKSRGERP